MKKTIVAILCSSLALSAQAHRVWVESEPAIEGKVLHASLGYGEFPVLEEIPAKRLHFFDKGMSLLGKAGTEKLKQVGKNYQFESQTKLTSGTYVLSAQYNPTFWSKNATGWQQADMLATPNATYCEQTAMYGKQIINVGNINVEDSSIFAEQVGHELEIVPMVNPASVKVGERFKVVVLYQGDPLPEATLTATFKGFDNVDHGHNHKVEAQAFSDTTGQDGTVDIIPLKEGFWKASVVYEVPFKESKQCQKAKHYATMTFNIDK